MNISNAALIQQAKSAIKLGQKEHARALLKQAIRQNEQNHFAWALLAAITPSPKASLAYVHRAAVLEPNDPFVEKVLVWAKRRMQNHLVQSEIVEAQQEKQQRTGDNLRWQKVAIWGGVVAIITVLLFLAGSMAKNSFMDSSQHVAEGNVKNDQTSVVGSDSSQPVAPEVTITTTPTVPPSLTPSPTVPRIKAKNIASNSNDDQTNEPRATWTTTPVPTNTPSPTPTYIPTFVSPQNEEPLSRPFGVSNNERWIDIDLDRQTLNAYEGNELVFTTLVSSGTWEFPTVAGQFRIWLRFKSQTMDGRRLGYDYYLENVPYVMYFYQDYALHGTFWHNNFGTPMSHGCVNLKTSDAEWIYNWSSLGTLVNVHY